MESRDVTHGEVGRHTLDVANFQPVYLAALGA